MDTKTAKRLLANIKSKKKVGKQIQARGDSHKYRQKNDKEDAIIDAIDQRRVLTRYSDYIEKIRKGQIGVSELFQGVAPDIAIELINTAMSGDSEKVRLAAMQDLLDRAGYAKVQKHALATIDASQSKEALISLLLGASKDLKAEGIEIEDDTEDQD